MTIIVVLVSIAVVALALHWWTSRVSSPTEHGPPPLLYPLVSTPPLPQQLDDNGMARPVSQAGQPVAVEPSNVDARTDVDHRPHVAHHPPLDRLPHSGQPLTSTHLPDSNRLPTSNGLPKSNGLPNSNHLAHSSHLPNSNPLPLSNHRPHVDPRPVRGFGADHENAETIRFTRPVDQDVAVQLLPGRLEVLEGPTPHKEIRFMRIPGEPPYVVLGREVRFTPHYVGLGSPTVSRRHARFDFADGQWMVKNLSRTNPLVINDDELFDTDVARPLIDGDRLELGDVVLRFHAH